jgi:Uma2 family endonuclease
MTPQNPSIPAAASHGEEEMLARPDEEEMPILAVDMPIMYEDEGQEQMGDSNLHSTTIDNLKPGLIAHLSPRPQYQVFSDINTYYHRVDRWAYFSADLMAVVPPNLLPEKLSSYRIGVHGPAPVLTIEVLSPRSFQQQDLTNKPIIYAQLGIKEYILVDVSGELFPRKLLLRRLQSDGEWLDLQDADGGVTSELGFRIILDPDGQVRVTDQATGKRYLRLREGQAAADALAQLQQELRQRDDRIKTLEEELSRLRAQQEKKE